MRQLFPALADRTYLNFGGQGVLATSTQAAIMAAYAQTEALGPFSRRANAWLGTVVADLRLAIANSLGTTPEHICLTENTTAGMNIALWGYPWQAGDVLLIADTEHYGILAIAKRLAARHGVIIERVALRFSDDPLTTLAAAITPATKMALISHVCWTTGRLFPLSALAQVCNAQGVLLVSDAAQAWGIVPPDLAGVAAYAMTGHKWCCGPAGVGALYLSDQALAALTPTYTGWRDIEGATGAARYEVATSAYPLYAGLSQALGLPLLDRDRQQTQAKALWLALQAIPGVTCLSATPPAAGLVSFTVAGQDPTDLEGHLEAERSICIRAMADPVCLRASVHSLTTDAELAAFVQAIQAFS